MRLIDADALEKEGWLLHRTYQKDKATMIYEVKAISEINTAHPDVPDTNVGDTISKQAAIRLITGYNGVVDKSVAKRLIAQLPSAQPKIIRCKDCKHYVIHSFFGRSQGWCERLCDEFDKSLARGTEPDDYCSRAEPYQENADA